jgi:peptidoglycan/xylan/chitin deacetylase (PgdA/CDA1 family)
MGNDMNILVSALAAAGVAGLAAGGFAYAAVWPESQIFGWTMRGGSDGAEIALTFDDGPNDACTGELLDVLAKHDVRATFFMVGQYVRQSPGLARRVREAGHVVGNHTVTHPLLARISARRVREELAGCNAILEDTLGERVRYFRPPFGGRRPDVLRTARELGLIPVTWNVTGHDWAQKSAEEVYGIVKAGMVRNEKRNRGSNVLLHDGGHLTMGADRSRTVRAVEMLLAQDAVRAPRKPEASLNGASCRRFVAVDAWG